MAMVMVMATAMAMTLELIPLIFIVPHAFILGYMMGFGVVEFLAMGTGVLLMLLLCTFLVLLVSAMM